MKALRSSPFLPVACLEHVRILSCCETLPDAAGASTLIAAVWILAERGLTADVSSADATGTTTATSAARVRAYSVFFIAILLERVVDGLWMRPDETVCSHMRINVAGEKTRVRRMDDANGRLVERAERNAGIQTRQGGDRKSSGAASSVR